MRIGICLPETESYHSITGGAISKWVYNVTKNSIDLNWQIIGFGSTYSDSYFRDNDVVKLDNIISNILLRLPLLRRLHVWWYAKLLMASLDETDAVHIHNQWKLVEILRRFGYTKPIVLHMHNDYLDKLKLNEISKLENHVDLFLFCSRSIFISSRVSHGVVLHNGYDSSIFKAIKNDRKGPFTIGFAARLDKNKGLHYLIRALPVLKRHYPRLRVLIAGNPEVPRTDYQKSIVKAINDLNQRYGCFIELRGVLRHVEMPDFYRSIDLLWAVSVYREAFGMNLIEAVSCGTQVIVNNIGGVEEALGTNKFGFLEFRTPEKVIEIISMRIENASFWDTIVDNSKNYISANFKWDKIRLEYSKILHGLIESKSGYNSKVNMPEIVK